MKTTGQHVTVAIATLVLFLVPPTVASYADETACKEKTVNFPLPGPDGETLDITFECNKEQDKISACQLPGEASVRISDSRFQSYTSKSGNEYAVTCNHDAPPGILEKFVKNVCATDERSSDVEISGETGVVRVKFSCYKSLFFLSCTAPGWPAIRAGNDGIIDGPCGKGMYKLSCNKDGRPKIRLTFAAAYCRDRKEQPKTEIIKPSGSKNEMHFKFVCNKAKNTILKCVPQGYDAIGTSTKPRFFGGDFGNKYSVSCSTTEQPTNLQEYTFAEQVCSVAEEKRVKVFTVANESNKVTFYCEKNSKNKIESCKPEGRLTKIKATETGSFGGPLRNSYTLTCKPTEEPELSVKS